ncbi:MAG: S-layer homology domain-containing protein [Butyricicoccus pullicaecorum]|nr:S-layer homology domain-containing protein [Butyricicoccus pullicaecorum]
MRLKRLISAFIACAMLVTFMPMQAFAAPEVDNAVTATKTLVSETPDADGNYTIQLTVQGDPVTSTTTSKADVVLVVDNSGSMATSVGSACGASKENFVPEEHLLWITYTCPDCGAKYTSSYEIFGDYVWDERPDTCTGEIGAEPRIETAQKVGKKFAGSILNEETDNQMAVVGFAHGYYWGGADDEDALIVRQGLTNNLNEITDAIDNMEADGGTNYTAALQQAHDWLDEREDKTRPAYVIFISDGAPGRTGESIGNSRWNGSEQAAALKDAGVNLYTIGIALDEDEDEYLESLASDAQYYRNVTGTDYDEELSDILDEWADEINTVPAGTDAVMTDVISDGFTLVSGSQSKELTVGDDGKTLTWNIGDIPEKETSVQFKVHPNDGLSGQDLHTNAGVELTYIDAEGQEQTQDKDDIGDPVVDISAPAQKHEITVEVVNGSAKYNDQAVSSPISINEGDDATISFEANAGYALDAVTVDGELVGLADTVLTADGKYTFADVASEHSITVVCSEDDNNDGIPDKYQATATYKVENGTWNDETTADKTEVVTLLNDAGNWSESGKGTLQHKPEVGDYPAEGYEEGSWNKNDTEITADTEFIYSYRETGEIDPPVTPEWDTSKSKTAKNLDANYESQVTLSLPSAQETLESDVVFVLDKSSCEEEVTTEALAMLEELYASVQNSGATINVGAVQFAGRAVVSCELTPLSEEAISEGGAIYSGLKETKIKSGTNLQAGLLEAQKLLAADTAVADNRKYVVVITDGLTRQFLEGDTLMTVYNALEADGNRVWGSPSGWCIANGFVDGVYQIPGGDWDTYFAAVKQNVARDGNQYAHGYDVYGSTPEGENIPSPYVPAEGNSLTYALCLDRAIYEAEKVYRELETEGYHCYAVFTGTPETSNNQLGEAFVKYLNNGNHLDFDDIQNDIYYLLDAGSYVVDVIGSGNDNYGNAYNFDFVNDIDKLELTVNGIALDKEKIDEYTYGFGKLEVNSNSARKAYYTFILRYHPEGIEGNSECLVWEINTSISNFAPVQLTYTVKLTNPQTKPGTYGEYDADGSEEKGSLYTNNSATLHPVDSNGVAGAPETFAKPTVSYRIEDTTITVTFRPGNHGTLRNAQADGTVRYSDIEEGKGLGADQSVPRVDEDDDWDFTEWLCTEGSDNMEGRTYTAAEIADLVFTVDTDFVAQYEEESGGGGAHHPDAGDDDDDDNDRDDDTEEIIDEEVPLAETPWLNTEDHYAYIIGYSEDGTVRPNANITRAEVATIFFRLLTDEARDQFWMTSNNFSDVLPNDWYNNAVSTMVNMGIIQGYEDGTFRPNANITRAEFAAIAARFMASGYGVEDDLFTDIANHWARESINDAAMAGWINGYEDGTFRPDAAITRAEAVTLVNNVLQRKPDADHMLDSMIKWPDNPEGTWYYEAIQEATNSHDYDLFEDAEYETWTALQPNRDWAALEKDWANAHSA